MFKTGWFGQSGKTVSDEGFTITLTSRTTLLYEVGEKAMVITTEGVGRFIDVFHSSTKYWKDDAVPIAGSVDEHNVDNVTLALESAAWKFEL